jgi:hypothetical protein
MGKSSKTAAAAVAPVSAAAKVNADKKSEKKGKKVVAEEVVPVKVSKVPVSSSLLPTTFMIPYM